MGLLYLFTHRTKSSKLFRLLISALQGKVLKEVFLFQLTPQVRDTVAGNILLATKCWVHWMWMVLLREVHFDLSGKGSTNYPSNFFPQQGSYRRRFIAYENSTHRYSQSGIQRSVLLNLLRTNPSFYTCFVTYESIPGNKKFLICLVCFVASFKLSFV